MKKQDNIKKLPIALLLLAMLVLAPAAMAASISTDKQDYEPNDTVTYTGSGFTAGEAVDLSATGSTNGTQISIETTADANGCISGTFDLPLMYEATYDLTATGASSGSEASASFSDAVTGFAIASPSSPVSLYPGETQVYTVKANTTGNNPVPGVTVNWTATGGTMSPLTSTTGTDGKASSTYTAGSIPGTSYAVTATAPGAGPSGNDKVASQGVTVLPSVIPEDTTPPTTTIELSGDQYEGYEPWYVSVVDVTLSATDDGGSGVAEIHYILNGGTETIVVASTATFTIATEDIHTLDYWAVDNATPANEEATNTETIKIDWTPPEVTITSPVPGCYQTAPALLWSVVEVNPFTVEKAGYSTDEGEHTVTVTATDAAGNEGLASVTYTVDKTPAVTTITLNPLIPNGTNDWYTCDDVDVTLTATDVGGSGVKEIHYILNGGTETVVPPATATFPIATDGIHTLEYWAVDNAGNVELPHNTATIKIDKTPPTISASATNADDTAYAAGTWTKQTVTVHFTCSDPGGSGVASCPADVTVSTEGVTPLVSGTATDNAGNSASATFGPIKIDKTPPTITADGGAYTAGTWTNQNVTVHFTCSDPGGSGVASCPADVTVSAEGVTPSVSGTATDNAGNSASASFGPIQIDKTPPVITAGTPTGTQGNNAWWISDVTVPFSATDNLSGFAPDGALSSTMASKTTSGEGSALTVTSDGISDMAGNAATGVQAGPYKVDKTLPVITAGTPTGTPGNNAWWISDVTVPFSATDNLSGFAPGGALSATMASKTTSGEGSALTVTSDGISDMAGNAATGVQSGPYKVDKTPPVVTITVPTEGAEYLLNQNVSANWSATDAPSGIDSAVGTVPSGSAIDTSSVGPKTFTVTATDKAGKTTVKTVNYCVRYNFIGFLPPVDNPQVVNVGKAGRTFPIKWQLKDANGNFISSLSAVLYNPLRYGLTTGGSTIWEDLLPGDTSGASGLRYDSASNQYIFTWQTSNTFVGKSYELLLELTDGTVHKTLFKFTK